ncbi:MAG: hypothetical protein HY081_10685 [Gammaproteobacteria bacterium]|nr:hypothetical protein [Gammaproteobacteria bacterium]
MLSFLYRLIEHYHREHGLHPNLLYLSPWHYQKLLECLPTLATQEAVCRFLAMQLVINPEIAHPHVTWQSQDAGEKALRRLKSV